MQWLVVPEHDISRFAKFLKNENSLEIFIVIFENSSPKGFSGQKIKKSIKITFVRRFLIFTGSRS